jgi:hypothetical protein
VPAERRFNGAAERGNVVPALETVDDATGGVGLGDLANQRGERLGGERRIHPEIADRVAGRKIVARAHDDQIRPHPFGHGRQEALPRRHERFGAVGMRRKRHVDDRSGTIEPLLRESPGSGICREGVRRNERNAVARGGLRAVAVMVIEVDDQGAAAPRRNEGPGRERRVSEDAEAHAARGLRVMAGWTNERERGRAVSHRDLHRRDGAARGPPGNGQRRCVDHRVARREVAGRHAHRRDVALDAFEVGMRMNPFEFRIARVARGGALGEEARALEVRGDARHAVGRFGMRDAPQVLGEKIVVDDDHCYRFSPAASPKRLPSAPVSCSRPAWRPSSG